MKLKQFLHIGIFLFVTLGLHFGFMAMDKPGSIAALVFIPFIYACVHLIKSLVYLFKKQKRSSLNSLIIGLLFALLVTKFFYYYYSLPLSILFLIFSIWVTMLTWKKNSDNNSKKHKVTLLVLLVLNIGLISIPDITIGHYLNPRVLKWQSLTWNDFKKAPNDTSDHDAETYERISYKINRAYNYPPAIVFAEMDPQNSWVKIKEKIKSSDIDLLLEHEQGHFDLTEFYTRKINDSISTDWGKSEKEIETTIQYWIKEKDSMQKIYDNFTNHGLNAINQHLWTVYVQKALHSNEVPDTKGLKHLVSTYQEDIFANKPTEEIASVDTASWKTLSKYNFTIRYPANWELSTNVDSGSAFILISPRDSISSSRVAIGLKINDSVQDTNIDSYANSMKAEINAYNTKAQLIEKRRVRFGTNSFYYMLFSLEKNGNKYNVELWFLVTGKKSYILKSLTYTESFDRYRKTIESIMGSFTLSQ